MVIVLMGPEGSGVEHLGREVASHIGWRCVAADAPHTSGDLAVLVAQAYERRESLVLVCERLTARQRTQITGGLRSVRLVSFGTALEPGSDIALLLNDAADVAVNIGRIRLEFGV